MCVFILPSCFPIFQVPMVATATIATILRHRSRLLLKTLRRFPIFSTIHRNPENPICLASTQVHLNSSKLLPLEHSRGHIHSNIQTNTRLRIINLFSEPSYSIILPLPSQSISQPAKQPARHSPTH